MNKKMKIVVAGIAIAALIAGGGIALGVNQAIAAPAKMEDSNGDCAKPKDGEGAGQGRRPEGRGANGAQNKAAPASTTSTTTSEQYGTTVVVSGGFETDPVDHGRPVALIAAALGVKTETFREAFEGVTPAGADRGPTAEEAQKNKAALLKVLAPLGITNERLDEVSNYYRYNGSKGQLWPIKVAKATATVANGKITGITITDPGSGYTSAPTITVTGPNGEKRTAKATIAYTKDIKTNGSLSKITLD